MNASDGLFGIVTPYRNQANALQSVFAGSKLCSSRHENLRKSRKMQFFLEM
jgi:hypothetical protein